MFRVGQMLSQKTNKMHPNWKKTLWINLWSPYEIQVANSDAPEHLNGNYSSITVQMQQNTSMVITALLLYVQMRCTDYDLVWKS